MSFGMRDIAKEKLRRAGNEVLSDPFGAIWRPDRGMIIAVFDDRPTAEKVLKSQGFKKQRAGKLAPDALWKRGATENPRRRKNPISTWWAEPLTSRAGSAKQGPFRSAAEAKRWLSEYRGERGPWGKLHREMRNDGSYYAYYAGDDWAVESIGPEWKF